MSEEYVTLDDAAAEVGLKRPSIYYYITELDIKRYRFKFHRHSYIKRSDVERIKEAKQKLSIPIDGETVAA